MFDTLLYEKIDGVAWITLNRPQALNAINLRMRDELWQTLLAVRDDPEVAVAVFKGAGERAFSAGADITEFGTAPSYVEARQARRERDLWGLLLRLDKPLIAAVHGYTLGAALELALLCDLRLAAEDARLGLPEVNLGYLPAAGGTQLLPRTAPPGIAMEMLLTGDPIDARTALRLGLVQRLLPRHRLHQEAERLALRLRRRAPLALRYAKQAVRDGLALPLAEAISLEGRLAALALASADACEGLSAHLAGRTPRFVGA